MEEDKRFNILLLTNRDSDNTGDQVIEACDISLIKTALYNLKIEDYKKKNATFKTFVKKVLWFLHKNTDPRRFLSKEFRINSRAAAIVTNKYMDTRDPEDLKLADDLIKEADLIVFGGAPMFNYRYQRFYERTAITLELAKKYNVPVIFSAVGVEDYSEDSEKCQRLKKTLNFDIVKMITTRDGYHNLVQYKENLDMKIGKVADPAVFTKEVFSDFLKEKKEKKIGIFVLRSNGFVDNGFDFRRDDAAKLWLRVGQILEEKGYEYEYLTSGHFGDEAFLDYFIREYGVDQKKCVFNMNTPEQLVGKVSQYAAVVSTRLHPSIVSYSLGVPSVGVIWNNKVKMFYESTGRESKTIGVESISAEKVVELIEASVKEGNERDTEFIMSIYNSLFEALSDFVPGASKEVFSYEQVKENMFRFKGTSEKEKNLKLMRKFRRAYSKYNVLFGKQHK